MLSKLNGLGRRARLAVMAAMVAALTLVPAAAFAEETNGGTDLSGVTDGVSGLVDDLTGLITDNLPYVFAILALTIGVPLIVKFVRRFT